MAWKAEGRAGLKVVARAGCKPRLDAQQLAEVDAALRRAAQAHGFSTELWTLSRIATVIARRTGVRYHPGARVVPLAAIELVAATAGAARPRMRRGGHSAL